MINLKKIFYLLVCSFFILFLNSCKQDSTLAAGKENRAFHSFGKSFDYSDVLVKRVIDGDTLLLEDGEKVRLIGIDTPEMHESAKLRRDAMRTGQDEAAIQKLGKKSYEFTKNLVEGKRISLDFDVDKRDIYNRLLAYAYLKDGTFINAEIVKEGYASLLTFPPNVKHVELFSQLYKEARQNKRGLWK